MTPFYSPLNVEETSTIQEEMIVIGDEPFLPELLNRHHHAAL